MPDDRPGALEATELERLPCKARELESSYSGIRLRGSRLGVSFIQKDDAQRRHLRLAETAKYLRAVHAENGYEDRASHYYVLERRQRRLAMRGSILSRLRRAQDYVVGDWLWRYGSSVFRPAVAIALISNLSA